MRRPPAVVPALIAINVGVFLAALVIGWSSPESAARLEQAGWVGGGHHEWYRFVTSTYLHAGWLHLGGNMLFLWVFGQPVEDRFGRFWFALFYTAAGVVSGLVQTWADPAPTVGASGAIAGVAGAFLVLFPLTRVRTLMFFGLIGLVMIPSWFFVGLNILFNLFDQGFREDNVANMAHLGGYGFGIAVAIVLLWTKLLSREPYDLFSMVRHRGRRRAFRSAARVAVDRPRAAAAKPDPETDELAERRARVSMLVGADRMPEAGEAYRSMLDAFAHRPHAGTLAREPQLKLVGYLLADGQRPLGARALEGFIATYPRDPERETLILLLGRVYGRDLGNAMRARELLGPIAEHGSDEQTRRLARDELDALDTLGAGEPEGG